MNLLRKIGANIPVQRRVINMTMACNSRGYGNSKTTGPEQDQHMDDDIKNDQTMDSIYSSLNMRGYRRPQRSYTPPSDVEERVRRACVEASGSEQPDLSDPAVKFGVLVQCEKLFSRRVLNSVLHTITSAELLLQFYKTPVDIRMPLDRIKDTSNLPQNLIFVTNKRFNPETDTMFHGVSAFPGDSTLVTGLKTRKKFKGHKSNPEWARYNLGQPANYHGYRLTKSERPHDIRGDHF